MRPEATRAFFRSISAMFFRRLSLEYFLCMTIAMIMQVAMAMSVFVFDDVYVKHLPGVLAAGSDQTQRLDFQFEKG